MTYFTELPDQMTKRRSRFKEGKATYDSPEQVSRRLAASSRCSRISNTASSQLYRHARRARRFPHINGFFSKDLAKLEEDKASGWIFAQGGRAYIAYRPLSAYEWRPLDGGDKRLFSAARQNGTVVQVASAGEFKSWEDFKTAIRALPIEIKVAPKPSVKFTTLRGKKIECTYGAAPRVDGHTVDYAKEWKLFSGPYLNAEVGSESLTMTHGKLKHVLDFKTLSITDSVMP